MYHNINQQDLTFFETLLQERCKSDLLTREAYNHDYTEDLQFTPSVVLLPQTTQEVAEILAYCNKNNIPVTPAGARTGLSGGCLPIHAGVLLSCEKLNRIIEIDVNNAQLITEPGVITEVLQNAVKEKGLFYPPDPASKGSCFIGGNIAENSGGPKAVKYGVTKDYVLNLEIVLTDGTIMWTGANVLKNATGYNLTQLLVGSEGTLAFVTKIVLKLIPHPTHTMLMLVPFYDAQQACQAVASVFNAGYTPSGIEFMEQNALKWSQRFSEDYSIEVKDSHAAHLLIEVDGFEPEQLIKDCEGILAVLEQYQTDEILFAESEAQKNTLWNLRRKVGEAVKVQSIYKEEDTVVPRYQLPQLLAVVKAIGDKYGFESVCYGHAGDGNLHVNIIKGNLSDTFWNEELSTAIRELFTEVIKMGGTISGEHGIGLVQKPYMDLAFSQTGLDLMRGIKKVFDPKGILNPGKIF